MQQEPFVFYFNADFDFKLQNGTVSPKIASGVASMAPLFAPALPDNTKILSDITIDPSYYSYLRDNGIPCAELTPFVKHEDVTHGEAWGWNKEALGRLHSLGYTTDSPSTELCTFINSRAFAHNLHKKQRLGAGNSQLINTYSQLIQHLPMSSKEHYVIKPNYGNSGAGFIRFDLPINTQVTRNVNTLLNAGPVIVETWYNRTADIASLFRILPSGDIEIIGHHQNICNSAGAFYGTLISTNDQLISQNIEQINVAIKSVAQELHHVGYFGLVSIDSFIYEENGVSKKALAIDINGRYTMSYIAHELFRKTGVHTLFYRFISKKRHTLPATYTEWKRLNQIDHYSRESKRGILLASPLRIIGHDGVERQPARSAFAITGSSIDDVMKMDNELRKNLLHIKKQ